MSFKRFVLKSTFYSGLSVYIESLIGLLISILIARQLGPEELGIYSLFMWFSVLGITVANGGLNIAVIKFLAETRSKGELDVSKGILSYVLRIQMIFLPVALMISFAAAYFMNGRMVREEYTLLLFAVILALVPKALQLFFISVAKGYESFKTIFLVNVVVTPLNLIMVLIVIAMDGGIKEFVWAYLLASVMYFLVSVFWTTRRVQEDTISKVEVPEEYKERINNFIKIATLNAMFVFIVGREIEIVFLNWFASASDAGYYAIAFRLSEAVVVMVPGIFGVVLLPLMARSLVSGKDVLAHRFRESGRLLMLMSAPFFTFGVVFAEEIIETMYGDQYLSAITPLRVFLLVFSFTLLNGLTTSILLSLDRQKTIFKVMVVTALINVVLDVLLIRFYELNGAVVACVLTKLIFTSTCQIIIYRLLNTRLPYFEYFKVYLIAYTLLIPVFLANLVTDSLWVVLLGGGVFFVVYFTALIYLQKFTNDEVEIMYSYFEKVPVVGKYFKVSHSF